MNAYFVHMLERAREVNKLNLGLTGRDSPVMCPFCIADDDETWFRKSHEFRLHPDVNKMRPERMEAPHCQNCPLRSLFGGEDLPKIMDNCVEMGFYALRYWEDTDE